MTKNKQTFSIRETAEILVPDRFGRTSYFMSLIIIVIMLAIISLLYTKLPLVTPLYFTQPWGEGRLVPKLMLYMLPAITTLCTIFNLMIGRAMAKLSPLLPRVLAVASAVIASMMLIALFGIVQSLIL